MINVSGTGQTKYEVWAASFILALWQALLVIGATGIYSTNIHGSH